MNALVFLFFGQEKEMTKVKAPNNNPLNNNMYYQLFVFNKVLFSGYYAYRTNWQLRNHHNLKRDDYANINESGMSVL